MFKFSGTGVALVTPFNSDGSIDFKSLKKIVNHVINNGVEYLVALGTTSEVPVLSESERKAIIETIIQTSSKRVPIVLGMGGNNTNALIKQIEQSSFDGIDGLLSVVPYYNKPQQQGLYQHFQAIADSSPTPVILYNVPGRTGTNMLAETTLQLAHDHSNIIAIKEASGSLSQVMEIIANKPKAFEVISGDDALTLPLMALGAKGVISVTANACTKDFTEMVRLMLNNETKAALKLHYKLLPIMETLFADGSPAGIKALLAMMNLCENKLRLPLVPVNTPVEEKIKTLFNQLLS